MVEVQFRLEYGGRDEMMICDSVGGGSECLCHRCCASETGQAGGTELGRGKAQSRPRLGEFWRRQRWNMQLKKPILVIVSLMSINRE